MENTSKSPCTLVIRHLPEELNENEQTDFFQNFGATSVRSMGHKGKLKHVAFATFPDESLATVALKRLHQLDILGHRLVVEFSKLDYKKHHPTELKAVKTKDIKANEDVKVKKVESKDSLKKESDNELKKKIAADINKLNEKFGMEYPLNPKLQYMYPPPTVTVLTNIANALASVPKFYVQVLHLMNKMNLPAPFGHVTMTPPLPSVHDVGISADAQENDVVEEAEMEMSSEEESELESEEEGKDKKDATETHATVIKRKKKQDPNKRIKRTKLHLQQLSMIRPKAEVQKVEEVFELSHVSGLKKTEFKLNPVSFPPKTEQSISFNNSIQQTMTEPSEKAVTSWDVPDTPDLLSITENAQSSVVESGFGKIEPVPKAPESQEENEEEEEEWGATEFISSRKLRRNRLTQVEMRTISAFRNYQEGEPTSRLYIKNLAKQVNEKDLHYVFGKYVNWEDEAQKLVFDIRLMKEGRMKGQAFITLPDDKKALEALRDTHGFTMKGKPIVVQFARSAKPKKKKVPTATLR